MPDMEEAEGLAAQHVGLDNDSHGRMLSRLIRQMRFITNRLPVMVDRVKALEDRVKALEDVPPPPPGL